MEAEQVATLIGGSIIVILAAYYVIYFVANRKNFNMRGRHIRIRERYSISKDSTICLMEVGEKVYLIALSNGGATLLDTFALSDLADSAQDAGASGQGNSPALSFYTGPFPGLFKKLHTRLTRKKTTPGADFASTLKNADMDEFIANYSSESIPQPLRTAKKEDGIDELYRRIQNKRAAIRPDSGEGESDE